MKNYFKALKSCIILTSLGLVLGACQNVTSTAISTYSPQAQQSEQSNVRARWEERMASIREKRQARLLEMRERRLELSEKRKAEAAKRKELAELRRKEAQERIALRMSSQKAKSSKNQTKINRAFARAGDDTQKDKSLRVGWVKIDGKYVYRSARTIKAEQEAAKKAAAAAKRKARRTANPKGSYGKLIAKYAAQHGVPYRLARAVVQVESSFRANVTGGAGEIGLMQIKLATARGMGYKGTRKQLYNPATNLYWGMKYLGKAHRLAGGSTCGTILKYNAGHGAKRMNPVSRRYCNRVSRII
jgi:soluble lytic murein transglycosylase-like protein